MGRRVASQMGSGPPSTLLTVGAVCRIAAPLVLMAVELAQAKTGLLIATPTGVSAKFGKLLVYTPKVEKRSLKGTRPLFS